MTNHRGYNKNIFHLHYTFDFYSDAMVNELLFPFDPRVNQGLERRKPLPKPWMVFLTG